MRFALASNEEAEAAKRFVALMLRPETSDQTLSEFGGPIFGDPQNKARQTLGDLLSETNRWQAIFVRRGLSALPTDAYVDALVKANSRGAVFDCNQLKSSLRSIERRPNSQASSQALEDLISRQCR